MLTELARAGRRLGRSGGFSAFTVLTLALAVGATAAMFAVVDAVLIRPLPYPDAERLVLLRHAAPKLDLPDLGQSDATYTLYEAESRTVETIGAFHTAEVTVSDAGVDPERVTLAMGNEGLLDLLGARPALGRLFAAEDSSAEPAPVVLAEGFWKRRYGADPGIIGRQIDVNLRPRVVVGVMLPGVAFPDPDADLWMYMDPGPARFRLSDLYMGTLARLAPGASTKDAERELTGLLATFAESEEAAAELDRAGLQAVVRPLKEEVVGDAGTALWVLFGGAGILLLTAVVSVANLFVVRAEHRRREVAVRRAVGARARDVAGLYLTESSILALGGAAAGLVLAAWVVATVPALAPTRLPRLQEVALTGRVAVFAGVVAAVLALLYTTVATLRHRGQDVALGLKQGAAGAIGGAGTLRRLLVAAQVALSLILLVGSTLLVRSFAELRRVDPGFRAEDVLAIDVALPFREYPAFDDAAPFQHALLDWVRALPGVAAAGTASSLPLHPWLLEEEIEAYREGERVTRTAGVQLVTPGYLETLGARIASGTAFPSDARATERPVVITDALARRLFGSERAVGQRIRIATEKEGSYTIIGIVQGLRHESLAQGPSEALFVPILDAPVASMFIPRTFTLAVRTAGPPLALVAPIRSIVHEMDPGLPITAARTLDDVVERSTARTSFVMTVLLIAAGMALLLGAIGLYGVVAYTCARRAREFGLRLALGGTAADLYRYVIRDGVLVALAGVAAGLVLALALTRFLQGLLFGVSRVDPASYLLAGGALVTVALVSSWLPARRAARIDPADALRQE